MDKNPFAVNLAKLSLWLATLAQDLPFSFLDHALKCGDSLVGFGFLSEDIREGGLKLVGNNQVRLAGSQRHKDKQQRNKNS